MSSPAPAAPTLPSPGRPSPVTLDVAFPYTNKNRARGGTPVWKSRMGRHVKVNKPGIYSGLCGVVVRSAPNGLLSLQFEHHDEDATYPSFTAKQLEYLGPQGDVSYDSDGDSRLAPRRERGALGSSPHKAPHGWSTGQGPSGIDAVSFGPVQRAVREVHPDLADDLDDPGLDPSRVRWPTITKK